MSGQWGLLRQWGLGLQLLYWRQVAEPAYCPWMARDGVPCNAVPPVVLLLQQRTQLPVVLQLVLYKKHGVCAGRIVQRVGVCSAGARAGRAPGPVQENAGHGEDAHNYFFADRKISEHGAEHPA